MVWFGLGSCLEGDTYGRPQQRMNIVPNSTPEKLGLGCQNDGIDDAKGWVPSIDHDCPRLQPCIFVFSVAFYFYFLLACRSCEKEHYSCEPAKAGLIVPHRQSDILAPSENMWLLF